MRALIIAIAVAATAALGSVLAWQAHAAAPASPIPHVGPYSPIDPVACGAARDVHCGPGFHWVCGPAGEKCWCAPC
jgi:Flp pilus assembly protein CpaB